MKRMEAEIGKVDLPEMFKLLKQPGSFILFIISRCGLVPQQPTLAQSLPNKNAELLPN